MNQDGACHCPPTRGDHRTQTSGGGRELRRRLGQCSARRSGRARGARGGSRWRWCRGGADGSLDVASVANVEPVCRHQGEPASACSGVILVSPPFGSRRVPTAQALGVSGPPPRLRSMDCRARYWAPNLSRLSSSASYCPKCRSSSATRSSNSLRETESAEDAHSNTH
jgi:hypothetical protein